jgi:hypothetical protein
MLRYTSKIGSDAEYMISAVAHMKLLPPYSSFMKIFKHLYSNIHSEKLLPLRLVIRLVYLEIEETK